MNFNRDRGNTNGIDNENENKSDIFFKLYSKNFMWN